MSQVAHGVRVKSMKRPSLLSTPLRTSRKGREDGGSKPAAKHPRPPAGQRPPKGGKRDIAQAVAARRSGTPASIVNAVDRRLESQGGKRTPRLSEAQQRRRAMASRQHSSRQQPQHSSRQQSRRQSRDAVQQQQQQQEQEGNQLSDYQRRKRRENRHKESLYNTTKIKLDGKKAHDEFAAARDVYEKTKYRNLEVIDALYKSRLERPQTRTGIVPDEIIVTNDLTARSKQDQKQVFMTNRMRSHDTVVKGIIFQQPLDSELKEREPTPHDTIRKVGTPQTRSVPKVFLKPEADEKEMRRAYDETREIGDAIRNVMVEGNHVNRILAQEGKRVHSPRTTKRLNTPATRSLLKDEPVDFEQARRDREEQAAFYNKNKEWQLRSDVPDIFRAMRTGDTDYTRLVATPAKSRRHINTPTSRSIPRAFYRGPATTQEMIEANNESRREYLANKDLHFAARLPMLFPDDAPKQKGPRGLTPAHARAHVNTPFTRGIPKVYRTDQDITPQKLKAEVTDTREQFRINKGKHSGADLSFLFNWESSPVSSPEPY